MASKEKPRCGICREFWPTGETDCEGRRTGYCDEFPMAGLINEGCCCCGEHTPFKRKEIAND